MIRLIIVCDKKRTLVEDEKKFQMIIQNIKLDEGLTVLDKGDNAILLDERTLKMVPPSSEWLKQSKLCLVLKNEIGLRDGGENLEFVESLDDVLPRYKGSSRPDLLVYGGLETLKSSLPYSDKITVIESDVDFKSNVSFTNWEEEAFVVNDELPWSEGSVISLSRA
jgi:dihydrofolate reductase